jgi:hypothetical protein
MQAGVRHDELDLRGWHKLQEKWRAELPQLQANVDELESKVASMKALADEILDFYAR